MRRFIKSLCLLLILICTIGLFACGGKEGSKVYVEGVWWGYNPYSVGTSNESVVKATLTPEGEVCLQSTGAGKAEVYVYDCFNHKAIVEVTVRDDEKLSISYQANECKEQYVSANKFGVLSTDESLIDQSYAMQSAIDYAYENGYDTVYLYPGRYNVDFIRMREGVTLEMYSGQIDTKQGYTKELAYDVLSGNVTVLVGTRIMNNNLLAWGREGCSNFGIKGGVIDNQGSNRTIMLFACANNVTLENVIVKDIKNDHMLQLAGCKNVNIKNCMFVGFEYGGSFTREVIQIEGTQPPAFGTADSAPQRFEEGEFILDENITIENCYFGKSDELPAPHIAIGHHGYLHQANCVGLTIKNNVFEDCSYSSIRLPHMQNVEIFGNRFTANASSNKLCEDKDGATPNFIELFNYDLDLKYESKTGAVVTRRFKFELATTKNVDIFDNEFIVGEGSDKRIIVVNGTTYEPGDPIHKIDVIRQDAYNEEPYSYTGDLEVTNFISDVSFTQNKITYLGQPTYIDACITFTNMFGLTFANNQLNYANGVVFEEFEGEDWGVRFTNVDPALD